MHDFTPLSALIGGALIGLSASLLLLFHGRVAGISGLYATVLRRDTRAGVTPYAFLLGLLAGGVAVRLAAPQLLVSAWAPSLPLALAAGLLVGVGTRIGNGCTSGHGVCGLSRLSGRSAAATATFMAAGIATVFVLRHLVGGAS